MVTRSVVGRLSVGAVRPAVIAAGLLAAAVLAWAPLGASAKDGDIIRNGSCTGSSDWKLKLSEEDGRIEVEFEVDQSPNGWTWNTKLKRNGEAFWRGERTTQGPSGSFEVRKVVNDGTGPERIVARASYPPTGEVCRGEATFSA
jgi:hypothetical protein